MREHSGELLQALLTVCEDKLEELKNHLINMVRISQNTLCHDAIYLNKKC